MVCACSAATGGDAELDDAGGLAPVELGEFVVRAGKADLFAKNFRAIGRREYGLADIETDFATVNVERGHNFDVPRPIRADFPMPIEAGVYYCGFNSPKSFGGSSYFVEQPGGNWLIDSPKFLPGRVDRFESMGGIANIFLTHRDDVAEAEKYAKRFSSRRIIHRKELSSQPGAEMVIDGFEPVELAPGWLAIPTPGHTRGHLCLLLDNRFLFTGDHLWWSRTHRSLNASQSVCWYSWEEQTRSVATLATFTFEWVLPGHGERVKQSPGEMRRQIEQLRQRMRRQDY